MLDQLIERVEADEYVSAAMLGDVHIALGALDEGFEWYQRAYEDREPSLMYLAVDPLWDRMRSDPRWKRLVRRMGVRRRRT